MINPVKAVLDKDLLTRGWTDENKRRLAEHLLTALAECSLSEYVSIEGERHAMPSPSDIEAFRAVCRTIRHI